MNSSIDCKNLRILFVNDRPHVPQVTGGLQWNTHEICLALKRRNLEAALLCEVTPAGSIGFINRFKRRLKVFGDCPCDNILGYTCYRGWKPIDAVSNICKQWKPDVVVVQGSKPEMGLISLAKGIPTFYYFHFEAVDLLPDGEWRKLTGFLACSAFISHSMSKRYDVPISVLYPLVSVARAITTVIPQNVLSFGLSYEKGADFVINLAARLPKVKFKIIETWSGDIARNDELRKRAANIQNVEICSAVADVRKYLSEAKVLLVPSRWQEGWGRVVTEAQLNGIPVITSGTGGLPEATGTGGLNIPLDGGFEAWATTVERLNSDADYYAEACQLSLLAAQREFISEKYLIDNFIEILTTDHSAVKYETH